MDYTSSFTQGLVWLASLGFLIAVYYSLRLHEETRTEKYWKFLVLAALSLGVHQWIEVPLEYHLIQRGAAVVVGEIASIAGALFFAYAAYGLYSSIRKVKRR